MPFPPKTEKFDLTRIGFPEFWVTYKTRAGLTPDEMDSTWLKPLSSKINDDYRVLFKRLKPIILDWNVTDDEGTELPVPNTDKAINEIRGKVYSPIISYISQVILAEYNAVERVSDPDTKLSPEEAGEGDISPLAPLRLMNISIS